MWELESGEQRSSRRTRLLELDRALEVLEELNLSGRRRLPPVLRRRLEELGVDTAADESPSSVLERVLNGQEVYLLHPVVAPGEVRHRGRRRSVPTDL